MNALTFSLTGDHLFSGDADGNIQEWGVQLQHMQTQDHGLDGGGHAGQRMSAQLQLLRQCSELRGSAICSLQMHPAGRRCVPATRCMDGALLLPTDTWCHALQLNVGAAPLTTVTAMCD